MRNLLLLTATVLALGSGAARANTALDDPNDFLAGAANDADLDLRSLSVTFNKATQAFQVSFTVDGPFNTANAGNYVLGVNTGAGANHPFTLQHFENVRFDKAFTVTKTGAINNQTDITVTSIDNGFSLLVPLSLLAPSVPGFEPDAYGFNIWSRGPGNKLADFAPGNRMLTAVPEPTSWALMIAGFGLTGAAVRRSRKSGRHSVLA